MAKQVPASPAQIAIAVRESLADSTLGLAFETARMVLSPRERTACDLLLDATVTRPGHALEAAGYGERICREPKLVMGRLKVGLVLELGRRLKMADLEITPESFRDDLYQLAGADPADAWDDTGQIRPLRDWPKPLRRLVKSMKLNPLGQVESVVFEGRTQLLALLGKTKLVSAFDQKSVERRTYVIRDYTGTAAGRADGGALPAGPPRAPSPDAMPELDQAVTIAAEVIDRGHIPVSGQPSRPSDPDPDPAGR